MLNCEFCFRTFQNFPAASAMETVAMLPGMAGWHFFLIYFSFNLWIYKLNIRFTNVVRMMYFWFLKCFGALKDLSDLNERLSLWSRRAWEEIVLLRWWKRLRNGMPQEHWLAAKNLKVNLLVLELNFHSIEFGEAQEILYTLRCA